AKEPPDGNVGGDIPDSEGQINHSDLLHIYLSALKLAAEVDVYRLPFREHVERGGAGLAVAVAGVLGAAEWQMDLGANRRRVDVEDPGVEIAHGRKGAVDVLRIDRRGEPIFDAVADLDRLVERVARNH